MTTCLRILGGRWKPVLIFQISQGNNRFGLLSRAIPGISRQVLTEKLRELETDGVVERKIYAEIPPRVEYSLTFLGLTLVPIVHQMRDWGDARLRRTGYADAEETRRPEVRRRR